MEESGVFGLKTEDGHVKPGGGWPPLDFQLETKVGKVVAFMRARRRDEVRKLAMAQVIWGSSRGIGFRIRPVKAGQGLRVTFSLSAYFDISSPGKSLVTGEAEFRVVDREPVVEVIRGGK